MPQEELLAEVAVVLNDAGVAYVVTGSVVTSIYGAPRYTEDVDIVVVAAPNVGPALARAFKPPRYYVDAQDINDSLKNGIISNLIDTDTARKVDFHPLKSGDPFNLSVFKRRRKVAYGGVELWFPSPEDAILSKLRWARLCGDGERHLRDAAGVYRVQQPTLDMAYIKVWAERLGITDLLGKVAAGTGL